MKQTKSKSSGERDQVATSLPIKDNRKATHWQPTRRRVQSTGEFNSATFSKWLRLIHSSLTWKYTEVQTWTTQGTLPKTNSSPVKNGKNGSWESNLSFWGSAYFQGRTVSFGEPQQECADQLKKKRQRQLLCYWPIQLHQASSYRPHCLYVTSAVIGRGCGSGREVMARRKTSGSTIRPRKCVETPGHGSQLHQHTHLQKSCSKAPNSPLGRI